MAEDLKAEIKSLETAMQACDKAMDTSKSNGNAEAAAKHALRTVDLTSALNEKRRNLIVLFKSMKRANTELTKNAMKLSEQLHEDSMGVDDFLQRDVSPDDASLQGVKRLQGRLATASSNCKGSWSEATQNLIVNKSLFKSAISGYYGTEGLDQYCQDRRAACQLMGHKGACGCTKDISLAEAVIANVKSSSPPISAKKLYKQVFNQSHRIQKVLHRFRYLPFMLLKVQCRTPLCIVAVPPV